VILAAQHDLPLAFDLAHSLSEIPCSIHIAPLNEIRFLARSQITDLGGLLTLQVAKPPLSFVDLVVKRLFDIVVATTALIALSPLLLCVALAIKLDSRGNIIFRQQRHGYNNKIIRVFKFRTMKVVEGNKLPFEHAKPNDDRITAIGRILRRTNIDELPQLFNVLLGEMSIVGPRPHATIHNKMFEDQILPFARRHNVKPGITGWAQVNGYRGAADTVDKMRRRVEFDLYYIDNWSLFFDLRIILMTLLSRKAYMNAY
jgi:exopolysaccharide biosynthesis polyprenyl glycosylphosphotransferase